MAPQTAGEGERASQLMHLPRGEAAQRWEAFPLGLASPRLPTGEGRDGQPGGSRGGLWACHVLRALEEHTFSGTP